MGGGVLMRKLLSTKAATTDSVRENMAVMGKEAEQHIPNEKKAAAYRWGFKPYNNFEKQACYICKVSPP